MVIKAIIIIAIVVIAASIMTMIEQQISKKNRADVLLNGVNKIVRKDMQRGLSFKESMELSGLPVIALTYNKKAFNFIVDTGSNVSHINKELIDTNKIRTRATDIKHVVQGISGDNIQGNTVNITLSHNGKKCSNNFVVSDLKEVLDSIKEATGIEISGILGTDFFSEQKCIIDFNEYTIY